MQTSYVIFTDYTQNGIVIGANVGKIIRYFQFVTAYFDTLCRFNNSRTLGK